MSLGLLDDIRMKIGSGEDVSPSEALALLQLEDPDVYDLFAITNRLRHTHKGNKIRFCSIINAKSNLCAEDCGFCSQAKNSTAEIPKYTMLPPEKIVEGAVAMEKAGAHEYSIVTSGRATETKSELERVTEALKGISSQTGLERCASMGTLSRKALETLRGAGLQRIHHNLESSPRYYPNVCSTRSWESNVETIKEAKALGFFVCSGGIFGMGESFQDRVDLAFILKDLDVDSIPLNFYHPIPGTALENKYRLTPLECLKIIAMFRLVHPMKDIWAMGGREVNLRSLQSMIFMAGANGILGGNYLTTRGRPFSEDLAMIADLTFERA